MLFHQFYNDFLYLVLKLRPVGRIGSRAKSFLDKLLPASSSNSPRYKSLLNQLESICMKFNAQMIYKRLCSTSHISDPTQNWLRIKLVLVLGSRSVPIETFRDPEKTICAYTLMIPVQVRVEIAIIVKIMIL